MRALIRFAGTLSLLLLVAVPLQAVEPDEILDDPQLEARARALSAEVRCLVCQNESIDSSSAELARELRILLRERLLLGEDEEEIKAYLVSRYGDFVLLKPPFKMETLLLWVGPFVILIIGLLSIVLFLRRQAGALTAQTPPGLSDDEKARLAELIDTPPATTDAAKDGGDPRS